MEDEYELKKINIVLSILLGVSTLYGVVETMTSYNNLDIINNQHEQLSQLQDENDNLNTTITSLTIDRDQYKKRFSEIQKSSKSEYDKGYEKGWDDSNAQFKADAEAFANNGGVNTNISGSCKNPTIEGNISSYGKIYHLPGDRYYERTNPEVMFCTEADAIAAGFRKSE